MINEISSGYKPEDMLAIENIRGLEFKNIKNPKKAIVLRGVYFPERVAEIIYYMESHNQDESAHEWRNKIEFIFNSLNILPKTHLPELDIEKRWRDKFDNAYEKAKNTGVCPIGIPSECRIAFKNDLDSIVENERHLSIEDPQCSISIVLQQWMMGHVNNLSMAALIPTQ